MISGYNLCHPKSKKSTRSFDKYLKTKAISKSVLQGWKRSRRISILNLIRILKLNEKAHSDMVSLITESNSEIHGRIDEVEKKTIKNNRRSLIGRWESGIL